MADAIVSILLENLNSLILKEVKLLRGVKDDLEELQRNLSMIRAILPNAEAMAVENEQLKVWLSNLMDAAYDADDILSDWAVEAQVLHSIGCGQVKYRWKMRNARVECRTVLKNNYVLSVYQLCLELRCNKLDLISVNPLNVFEILGIMKVFENNESF
ncbi:putative disease resistance RPP13-like protein 2 isoform X1 [Tasmannia lanceolata]|uniref:putative disease resistance RPP13-like protein 2 isoform X1 n=1 Tax=Tasmannia lanceolata TaxID=3420 RepID=UPI004063E4F6